MADLYFAFATLFACDTHVCSILFQPHAGRQKHPNLLFGVQYSSPASFAGTVALPPEGDAVALTFSGVAGFELGTWFSRFDNRVEGDNGSAPGGAAGVGFVGVDVLPSIEFQSTRGP